MIGLEELQQVVVTVIDEQLEPGRDRGDRLQSCRDLQRILMGASFWLESCRRRLDLESVPEPTLEDHEEGVEQAMQGVRWVQLS